MRNSGYYSQFGGAFIPEILVSTFDELETAYLEAQEDPSFWQEYLDLMSTYSCRATPITRLDNFCLLYTSPSPRDGLLSRMPSSA